MAKAAVPKPPKPPKARSEDLNDEHWYVPYLDGTIDSRFDATLGDAKADQESGGPGLFPSPTTILSAVLAKPELEAYKIKAALMGGLAVLHGRAAGIDLVRLPDEKDAAFLQRAFQTLLPPVTDEDFRRAANKEGKKAVVIAQDFGTDVHAALDLFLREGKLPAVGAPARPHIEKLQEWFTANVRRVLYSETRLASKLGYAGTSDLGLELFSGERVVADTKTGNWKAKRKGEDLSPYFKLSHPLQVASYRGAAVETFGPEWQTAGGIILHVCSNKPMKVVDQRISPAAMDANYKAFVGLFDVWCLKNSYRPLPERMRASRPPPAVPDVIPHVRVASTNADDLVSVSSTKPPPTPAVDVEF